MFDMDKLIAAVRGSVSDSANVTVNVNINVADAPAAEPVMPDTDFAVDDRVIICHVKKDGTGPKHTTGTVIEILQQDDDGWYTRVLGDNGKHYRIGLKYDEARKGTKAIVLE